METMDDSGTATSDERDLLRAQADPCEPIATKGETDMSDEQHDTVSGIKRIPGSEMAYAQGGALEASHFAKGDGWKSPKLDEEALED